MKDADNNPEQQLAKLLERCKEIASLVGDGEEVFAECTYCHSPVSLWEALFTQQIAGVLAHVACPEEKLDEAIGPAKPAPEFDFEDFAKAVDLRMNREMPTQTAGIIEIDHSEG